LNEEVGVVLPGCTNVGNVTIIGIPATEVPRVWVRTTLFTVWVQLIALPPIVAVQVVDVTSTSAGIVNNTYPGGTAVDAGNV
jgi:hypothetical protein